jgi:hypothetical protein
MTEEERSAIINRNSTYDDNDDQSPIRPRIESKIGFIPPIINSSDNEQTNRNDNSNYDSLIGSLKSDTINFKDQQSTVKEYFSIYFDSCFLFFLKSNDEESDIENEKNLMLQKEQVKKET